MGGLPKLCPRESEHEMHGHLVARTDTYAKYLSVCLKLPLKLRMILLTSSVAYLPQSARPS